jgi:hypothetical protein
MCGNSSGGLHMIASLTGVTSLGRESMLNPSVKCVIDSTKMVPIYFCVAKE